MKIKRWVALVTLAAMLGMAGGPVSAEEPQGDSAWTNIERIMNTFADKAVWTSPQTANVVSDNMPVSAIMGNGAVGVTSYDNESGAKQYLISRNDFWSDKTEGWAYQGRSPSIMTVGGLKLTARRNGELPERSGNLLTGKTASISSGTGANDALNGSGDGWLSESGSEHTLTVDLTQETAFNRWTVSFGAQAGGGEYALQISGDGQTWTTVDAVSDPANPADNILVYPQTARYVRLSAAMESAQGTAHIIRFGLYREVNLASINYGASATADSTMTTSGGNVYGANHTIDETYLDASNYMNSGWVSVNKTSADNWLKVDLGQARTFDRWVVAHTGLEYFLRKLEADGKSTASYLKFTTRQYKLQVSENGSDWTSVDEVTGNTAGQPDRLLKEPVTARYVRLYIPAGGKDQQAEKGDRARVIKFQLYNNGEMTENAAVQTAAAGGYCEEMDIARAEIRTQTELGVDPVSVTSWLSATDNVMVTTVTSQSAADTVLIVQPYGSIANSAAAAKCKTYSGVLDGKTVWASRKTNDDIEKVEDKDKVKFISEAVIASRVVDGEVLDASAAGNMGELQVALPAGETVTIATAIEGVGGSTDVTAPDGAEGEAYQMAVETLRNIDSPSDVEQLHQAHLQWWREYYQLSWVDFQDADLNRIYYGQQYIFGSTVREGNTAPGLYGIWRTSDNPRWQGNFHLNYNFQATWYGSMSSNRMYDFFEPYVNEVLKYMDKGLERASTPAQYTGLLAYGSKCINYVEARLAKGGDLEGGIQGGVLYPVGITPFQQENEVGYAGQTMDAWFCATLLMNFFDYTLDTEWLNTPVHGHTPYELIRAVGTFYEKWLEKRKPRTDKERIIGRDDKNTKVSYALQNLEKYSEYTGGDGYVYVLLDGATESLRDCNPTGYLGVLLRLYDRLIDMSEELGVDADRRGQWADIRDHLVRPENNVFEIETTENGQTVKKKILGYSEHDYSMHKPGAVGGAEVQLELVQPGELWGFDSDPEILEVCRNTIEYHNTWTYANSIPKVYAHAARTGYDPETLVRHIKALANDPSDNAQNNKMKKNYHIYDGQHGVEKVGLLEGMNNLMCQSDGGIVKVFPAWPAARGGKFSNIREKGAFLLSSERAAGELPAYVDVASEKGQPLELVNPWNGAAVNVTTRSGAAVEVSYGRTRNSGEYTIRFDTVPGETYHIVRAETETAAAGPFALTLDGGTVCGSALPAGALTATVPLPQTGQPRQAIAVIAQYDGSCLKRVATQTENTAETALLQCTLEIVPEAGDTVKVFLLDADTLQPLGTCKVFEVKK